MSDQPTVLTFDQLTPAQHPIVGGKCASLGTMSQAGLPVPPGFAVTTLVFVDAKAASGTMPTIKGLIDEVDVDDSHALSAAAAQARDIVRGWDLPAEHEALIREKYAELSAHCGLDEVPVAVRSSATAEDSPDASFAGEHDTYLWVTGADNVIEKIKACWASLYTDRAIAYREKMGYDHNHVDMSVAVQKMVKPRAAGVAFTLDPTNGDRSSICIDSAWGFGEGVVSGDVTPDNFLVDKVMYYINRRTISPKEHAHLLIDSADGGHPSVVRVELPEAKGAEPSLIDTEIIAIAKLARAAEKHYGCPQDIEWAVDDELPAGEDIVLLQARPETVWSKKSIKVGGTKDPMASIVETLMNPIAARKG